MRFPNDTAFHLRMAALVIGSLFLEHLARTRLSNWSSSQIGIVTFVLGLAWVALFAFHHGKAMQRQGARARGSHRPADAARGRR